MHCRLLIASLRSGLIYAATVLVVVVAAIAGMPMPLASAVAAELPSRPPASTVAAAETTSRSPDQGHTRMAQPGTAAHPAEMRQTMAAAENTDAMTAIEPTSFWARTTRETGIWSGWDSGASEFAKIAPDITVQVMEIRGSRAFVYFPGDNKGHKAGEVWIDKADLEDVPWPRWARARHATVLRAGPDLASPELLPLARGSYIETTGETQGRWAQAFYLTDQQPGEWAVGWVDGLDLILPRGKQDEMSTYMLTRNALLTSTPEVWLRVPYRTQLDGSAYADANCGPTSVAMALEAIGERDSTASLRAATLELQDTVRCDDCGTYIQHLAKVAEMRGAMTYGLRDDPETFHRWTLDEVRQQLRQERVVIPQVNFRLLPGRASSPYGGDHYIVLVGMAGDNFIYNDPIDSDGRGYGRLISATMLEQAMASATPDFARTAFAVGRPAASPNVAVEEAPVSPRAVIGDTPVFWYAAARAMR